MQPDGRSFTEHDDGLLGGLRGPARSLLLQLVLYKSIFLGRAFRDLAEEEPEEVARVLLRIHRESVAEAAGLTLAVREWDALPSGRDTLAEVAADARRRFLEDLLALKEGVVDVGLLSAMRAPTDALRKRLLHLADMDRIHADELRAVLGSRPVVERLERRQEERAARVSGVGAGRGDAQTLRRALQEAVDDLRRRDAEPSLLILSADAMRHARDEGVIDPDTGRAFGIPVEIDMGWRGECFAVQTLDRVSYAELITSARGGG